MPTIDLQHITVIYPLAKKVYFNKMPMRDAVEEAVNNGLNENSAKDLINNFKSMYEGKTYKRTNNKITTEYFIDHIYSDFGISFLKNALNALEGNINYYESKKRGKLRTQRNILDNYLKTLKKSELVTIYPDEISNEIFLEGSKKQIFINIYKRNPNARNECIAYHKPLCAICLFDFSKTYGVIGKDFIHVHHIKNISTNKSEYEVDPINDLIPVCPNCHAMLHRKNPPYTIDELKLLLQK